MEFEKKRGLGVCRNGKRRLHKHLSEISVISIRVRYSKSKYVSPYK
jgi:hypothetical protein